MVTTQRIVEKEVLVPTEVEKLFKFCFVLVIGHFWFQHSLLNSYDWYFMVCFGQIWWNKVHFGFNQIVLGLLTAFLFWLRLVLMFDVWCLEVGLFVTKHFGQKPKDTYKLKVSFVDLLRNKNSVHEYPQATMLNSTALSVSACVWRYGAGGPFTPLQGRADWLGNCTVNWPDPVECRRKREIIPQNS